MNLKQIFCRSLVVTLSALLCNVPQYLAAQSTETAQQNAALAQDSNSAQQDTSAQNLQSTTKPDPSQAPLAPVPTTRPAETNSVPPDAPSEVQRSQQETAPTAPTATSTQSLQQQTPTVPLGTATAQQGATRGGVASRPAGEAIAPAKQRQVHSMLIKLGLVAAGAVAVGTVVGLTRGTSSIPPGAH